MPTEQILALISLCGGAALLIALTIIDLRTWLLPNRLVLTFAMTGISFHFATRLTYLSTSDMLIGAAGAFALLWLVRFLGTRYYGEDALGLGDVKLLGASGFWLGIDGALMAMTLGAFFGLLHGLGIATWRWAIRKEPFNIRRLALPAGPGFCLGIAVMVGWMLRDFSFVSP